MSGAVSDDIKRFHAFKNNFRLNFYKKENFKKKLMDMLGFSDFNSNKLTFKQSIVNLREVTDIDHDLSLHARSL